ncbi:G8 domain-containing protein [Bradyrhizobium mercantei]|uniref:G8 domain-containing protein n=1 Tax=Bradyrhizobium mercantei TaxID=1904807 RepID=UPI001356486B|nr:G8 domain-containing protein [Bradyrhizobium mercantei]
MHDSAHAAAMAAHPDDSVKRDEHAAMLDLAPVAEATFTARQSGRWLDAATWSGNEVPTDGARVVIPGGTDVVLDGRIADRSFEWVRVMGSLRLSSDKSTLLRVITLLVDVDGTLNIGDAANRVASLAAAEICFMPRKGRDRDRDPLDLGGGLLSHGFMKIYGAAKTPYGIASAQLNKGDQWVSLDRAVDGWAKGDKILLPGTEADVNHDEVLEVAEISAERTRVRLDKELAFDHFSPFSRSIPVSNLTRNVRFYSAETTPLAARGHVMIMHRQTGTVIDGASFEELGRTDASRAQTIPQLDADGKLKPGTDDNSIGRYALHFHLRSGARIEVAPHIVRNSVIIGSPKLGLVNHGGNVIAEQNIGYRIVGSHFFAENGSEIGAFIGNVAVRSSGSGDRIRARDMTYDFGHGGHGFWSQSGGIRMSGNYAFGHAGGAFVIFGYPFVEEGRTVFFDGHNIGDPKYADALGHVLISNVNFVFENNVAAGSQNGLEIWNHKIYNNHDEVSRVDGFKAWGVREYGVFLPYVKNTALSNLELVAWPQPSAAVGIAGNTLSENIAFDNIKVSGFALGIALPRRGTVSLRHATLANRQNIEISNANKPGRLIELSDLKLGPPPAVPVAAVAWRQTLRNWWHAAKSAAPAEHVDINFRDRMLPENGDIAMLFEPDHIYLTDETGRHRLYFETQLARTVVLRDDGPSALQGLTAKEVFDKFGLAVGDQLAPGNVERLAASSAWIDRSTAVADVPAARERRGVNEIYPMSSEHFLRAGSNVTDLWKVVEGQSSKVVFVDREPPRFWFLPGLRPFEIHPDDVQYGYRIMGFVADHVGKKITVRAFSKEYQDLKVDPDGYVRVSFTVSDMAGNETKEDVALLVTDKAVRRGANINFFVQKAYCGECGYDTLYQDIARMFGLGEDATFITQ